MDGATSFARRTRPAWRRDRCEARVMTSDEGRGRSAGFETWPWSRVPPAHRRVVDGSRLIVMSR